MNDTRGMLVVAVAIADDVSHENTVFARLETVFCKHFGFICDFEAEGAPREGVDGETEFEGIVYFHIDYMPIHASEARGCQLEMQAYIEAFLHGAGIEFEVIEY